MPVRLLFALACMLFVVGAPSAPSSAAVPDAERLAAERLAAPVRAKVEAALYAVRPSGTSRATGARTWHEAMNPAQDFRAVFTGAGIDVARPTARLEDWRWNMRLAAYGRADQVVRPPLAAPVAVENRVEYRYGDGLTEWFVNTAGGIEHGFTLAEPVRLGAEGQPLELVLAVHGDLVPRLTATGDVQFTGSDGVAVLGYRELHAWDAAGRMLPSRMAVVSGHVRLVVDDRDARYPVTIDPIVFDSTPLYPSNPKPDDAFGFSISIDGNYTIVGTPSRETSPGVFKGSVFVFGKSSGGWTQEAEIFASDGADADLFGASVSVSGTTLVVGAPGHNPNGQKPGAGAVYVFVRRVVNGVVTWTQQAKLVASDGAADDSFGSAVALSGDYVAIGAPENNPGGKPKAGKVYILGRSGVLWTEKVKLTGGAGGEEGDLFGSALAITQGGTLRTLVVGAPGINKSSGIPGGRASVFVGTGTSWPKQADLVPNPNDLSSGAAFGFSVGVSENTAVIGAPGQQVGSAPAAGAVYVFTRAGSAWSQQARLVASDGGAGDLFGSAVDIDENLVVIGSPFRPPSDAVGQAYVFIRTSTVWQEQTQQLKANPPAPFQFFGFAVSVDGTNIAIGAPFHAAEANPGPAYVFSPTASYAGLWIGLQNSDAVGLRIDLRTEVYKYGTLVAEGQINGIRTGSSGFNNAILQTVPLEVLTSFTTYTKVVVSARVSCYEPGHLSGVARLWYNGRNIDTGSTRDAGSRIAFNGLTTRFLRNIDGNLRLNTNAGTQRMTLDIFLDSSVSCPERPFTTFGAFTSEAPPP